MMEMGGNGNDKMGFIMKILKFQNIKALSLTL
jgi:hypothetical protein